jgi:mRNA-degrading endonuclease RelE of RelBE toxin-antitoxin system
MTNLNLIQNAKPYPNRNLGFTNAKAVASLTATLFLNFVANPLPPDVQRHAGESHRVVRSGARRYSQSGQGNCDADFHLAETGAGDVRKLSGQSGELRLRVGDWRVRFTDDGKTLSIHTVLHRKEAYR